MLCSLTAFCGVWSIPSIREMSTHGAGQTLSLLLLIGLLSLQDRHAGNGVILHYSFFFMLSLM